MHLFYKILRRLPLSKAKKEAVMQFEAVIARRWVSSVHQDLMHLQWSQSPKPNHLDHHIDLFYQWLATRNSMWLERGIFGSLALQGGDTLELACGDGFNARNFYSLRSRHVIACDFDIEALQTARIKNSAPNVEFIVADIRQSIPAGQYDNIIWDDAIEQFSLPEINAIFLEIKSRLAPSGIFSGHTTVENPDVKAPTHYKHEFKSKEELVDVLKAHFKTATVFESIFPSRYNPHNLYFWASDDVIPFDPQWHAVTFHRS